MRFLFKILYWSKIYIAPNPLFQVFLTETISQYNENFNNYTNVRFIIIFGKLYTVKYKEILSNIYIKYTFDEFITKAGTCSLKMWFYLKTLNKNYRINQLKKINKKFINDKFKNL